MIHTLATSSSPITRCPVLVQDDAETGLVECDQDLTPIFTVEVVGDDYGSWAIRTVAFPCGHTFVDMNRSLNYVGEM